MKRAWNEVSRGLEWCAALALVALSLPVLVVAVVLLRGVLLVAAIGSVIGSTALYGISPRFRAWVNHI